MIPKIVIAQLAVLILTATLAWVLYDGVTAISLFAAGISMLIPNLFMAANMFMVRFHKVFFWIGVFFNKTIILMLFLVSILLIKDPNLFAFLIGIIVVSQVPLGYVLISSIRRDKVIV